MKITKLLMMLLLSSGLVADSSNPNQCKYQIDWFSDLFITVISSTGLIPDDKSNNYYWWISPLIIDVNEIRDIIQRDIQLTKEKK